MKPPLRAVTDPTRYQVSGVFVRYNTLVSIHEQPGLGESTQQRVAIFVDTQNIYYAARDYQNGNVDYERLLARVVRGRHLAHATAYVVERDGDTSAHGFFHKLSALGYRVKRRLVRVHTKGEDGRTVLDGDWDMGIAADIVRAIDYADVIVLVSGDGDFVPILALAQERGKRIEVVAFRENASGDSLDIADHFVNLSSEPGMIIQVSPSSHTPPDSSK